jgi:hypothetical protein
MWETYGIVSLIPLVAERQFKARALSWKAVPELAYPEASFPFLTQGSVATGAPRWDGEHVLVPIFNSLLHSPSGWLESGLVAPDAILYTRRFYPAHSFAHIVTS